MPKLADVAGVRIVVWLKEHHPVPHIQTVGEHEFSLAIDDGRLLTPGHPDVRALRKVRVVGSEPWPGVGGVAGSPPG